MGQKVLGDSFIRHVIDLIGVIIQAKKLFFTALSLSLVLAMVGRLWPLTSAVCWDPIRWSALMAHNETAVKHKPSVSQMADGIEPGTYKLTATHAATELIPCSPTAVRG